MSKFFNFEDENRDFPIYNGIPPLNKSHWRVLLVGFAIFFFMLIAPIYVSQTTVSMILFLTMFIPTIYICKGNLGLFFRLPERGDGLLIVLCLMAYYIYTVIIVALLQGSGYQPSANAILDVDMNLIFWISVFFQLMGEELFKVLILLIIMYATYKFTKNRKFSLICGLIVTLSAFGLIHYGAYGNLLQIMLIQGLGSIFEIFTYLKTKNVLVSYILHLITDAIPFLMVMILKMNGMSIYDM